jgi:hypothetical protein
MTMITNILRSFQINEKEMAIFLKVLETGTQPASPLRVYVNSPGTR